MKGFYSTNMLSLGVHLRFSCHNFRNCDCIVQEAGFIDLYHYTSMDFQNDDEQYAQLLFS